MRRKRRKRRKRRRRRDWERRFKLIQEKCKLYLIYIYSSYIGYLGSAVGFKYNLFAS